MNLKVFRRKWLWGIGLLFAAAIWLFWPKSEYETYQVKKQPLHVNLVIPGRVESRSQEIHLSFDRPGTIQKIHVKEGDEVEAGRVLAELKHDDLEAQVEVAKWAVEEAKDNVRLLEVDNTYWEARLKRREQLGTVVSQEDLEEAKIEFHRAAGKLASARAHLKIKEGELVVAKASFEKAFLKASLDGKIVRVLAREGETVMTSVEPQPVAILADMARLKIRAEVDESQIRKVWVGQKAWVSAEAFRGERIPAAVVQVFDIMGQKKIETGDPKEKFDTDVLEILLDVEKHESLKLGLRVDVRIEVAAQKEALLVPKAFVYYSPQGAWVFKKGIGKAKQVSVELGAEQDLWVEVKSGLREGDVLVKRAS